VGAEKAFKLGYSLIKLYFMMGLPTEVDDDIIGIRRIIETIKSVYAENPKRLRGLRINVSLSTFIPKPFTPFQWEEFVSRETVMHKIELMKKHLFARNVSVSWNDYNVSEIEAVLARGDRKLSKVILNAYKKGCVFDSWGECFFYDKWSEAFIEEKVEKEAYKAKIDEVKVLAWDFIDIGVKKAFLLREKKNAESEKVTGGCHTGCKGCGLEGRCNL
jgi:radical SAM superfamily enzyme YgiQ (UPF0313 family)